jgi:hypothetical protein
MYRINIRIMKLCVKLNNSTLRDKLFSAGLMFIIKAGGSMFAVMNLSWKIAARIPVRSFY